MTVSEIQSAVLTPPETPEFPSATIIDSRRLMGPNLYSAHPGALLEVTCDGTGTEALLAAWTVRARELGRALGWRDVEVHARRRPAGADLFLSAPVDVLMSATEVNEQAWVAAESGATLGSHSPVIAVLRARAEAERRTRPHLRAVFTDGLAKGVSPTFDDEWLTVGGGVGARTWPIDEVPAASAVPWSSLRDIPVSLVTGSNGKTTTTRLVAAMWRLAGRAAGWSCSDGVWIENSRVETGDYSGPAGARAVLRDARVEAAVLETARGGILRRGLAVSRASAAIITNISADHLGEYGIDSLHDLADVKGVVAKALGLEGRLVLNADDPVLVALAARVPARLSWFSAAAEHPAVDAHVAAGGDAAIVDNGRVMLHRSRWHDLGGVDAMPLTLRGAARHNVENILGASLLAVASGVPIPSIRATLAKFGSSMQDNPGRLQVYQFGGAMVVVDFAHNPHGLAALCETAKSLRARRRLLVLGQAGNRDDGQLRALVRAAWDVMPFDRVIVKEMPTMLRGRAPGAVPRVLAEELATLGMPRKAVDVVEGELAAIRKAFAWARDGDVLVCPVHVEKAAVLMMLERMLAAAWKPGTGLPAATT